MTPLASQSSAPTTVVITVTGSTGGYTHTAGAVINGRAATIVERRTTPDINWTLLSHAAWQRASSSTTTATIRGARALGRARPREHRSARSADDGGSEPPAGRRRAAADPRRPWLAEARGRALAAYVADYYDEIGEQTIAGLCHDLDWPQQTVEAAIEIALELELIELRVFPGHIEIHPSATWRASQLADVDGMCAA